MYRLWFKLRVTKFTRSPRALATNRVKVIQWWLAIPCKQEVMSFSVSGKIGGTMSSLWIVYHRHWHTAPWSIMNLPHWVVIFPAIGLADWQKISWCMTQLGIEGHLQGWIIIRRRQLEELLAKWPSKSWKVWGKALGKENVNWLLNQRILKTLGYRYFKGRQVRLRRQTTKWWSGSIWESSESKSQLALIKQLYC